MRSRRLAQGAPALSLEAVERIDRVCLAFEDAWLSGRRPELEQYLADAAEPERPVLLRELLRLDVDYRRRRGETPRPEEYQSLPGDRSLIASVIEAAFPPVGPGPQPGETVSLPLAGNEGAPSAGADGSRAGEPHLGRFGPYELLEEIGRGGMGVVYRARQCAADRIVALKVIRRDRLDTAPRDTKSETMDRFRREVQAAARLEHDGIITVYDVGEVDGEPFFSMRYVEGRSLAEHLRNGPLADRKAAEYLEAVARAVEAAHRHGILHRDLKPQNILIDAHTDRPLVADFGLAKLAHSSDELTESGQVMGSPPYMSPEQAIDSSRVTAQTDVYALGATLYHMLTGRPPFHAASVMETLRHVIDEEPVPPRQLNPSVDRDLETICLKCLEKEPSRRYLSAEALADDLGRYLRGEPIQARPIGAAGRAWRWCRRNPAVAASIGMAVAFLVLALAATAIGYARTAAALRQSEASDRQAREMLNKFFTRVSEDTLLDQPGMQPLRRDLLQEALGYYERFLDERGDDPAMRDEWAMTHFRIGRISEEMGNLDRSMGSYRRALAVQEELAGMAPGDLARQESLSNTWTAIGRLLIKKQQIEESRSAHQQAASIRQRLAQQAPEQPEFKRLWASALMNLAIIDRERGRRDEARRGLEAAQALRREALGAEGEPARLRRDLAMGSYNLGILAGAAGDRQAAQAHFQEAIADFEEALKANPRDLNNGYSLALCYRLLGDVQSGSADPQPAFHSYAAAIRRLEPLALANPGVPDYRAGLAGLHMNVGVLQQRGKDLAAAEASFRLALQHLKDLEEESPVVPRYRRDYASVLRSVAEIEAKQGRFAQAKLSFEGALRQWNALVREHPDNPGYRGELAITWRSVAGLYYAAGDHRAARDQLETARKQLGDLCRQWPQNSEFARELEQTNRAWSGLSKSSDNAAPADR